MTIDLDQVSDVVLW